MADANGQAGAAHGGAGGGASARVLAAVFEGAAVPMAVLDDTGRIVEANRAWRDAAAAAGWLTPSPGSDYLAVVVGSADDGGEALLGEFQAVLAGERGSLEAEYEQTGSGGAGWVRASIRRLETEPPCALVVHRDVTEARRAQHELDRSQKEQEALLEQASEGVIISDARGVILRANERAAELFGYPLPELESLSVRQLLTLEEVAQQPLMLADLRDGRRRVVEREGRRKDGSRFTMEVSARRLRDGRILGLVRDTTARRRQEELLRQQAARLEARVREQRTLYAVSRTLSRSTSLSAALQEVVERLPEGWQHPDLAEASLTLDGREYRTPGFTPSVLRQSTPIVVEHQVRGVLEVVYRQAPPETAPAGEPMPAEEGEAEGEASVFLREEQALLQEIAGRVADALRRHRGEERLRRSEAYFRALTERGSDVVTITDATGGILYLSPSVRDVLGFEVEERLGQSVLELIHPQDRPRVESELARLAADPSHVPTLELRVRDRTGREHVFEATGRNLLDDPAVGGIYIESRDVTARQEAEAQVRFQAQLLDSVGQAVVATDVGDRITYYNSAAESLYGWLGREVLGEPVAPLIALEADHPGARAMETARRRREPWSGEVVVRRDALAIPLLLVRQPVLDDHDQFTGYVSVASDLSAHKRAERALRESQERLRALVENASDATLVLDAQGRVSYASPNRERILGAPGRSPSGSVAGDEPGNGGRPDGGRPDGWASIVARVHPEDRPEAERLWERVKTAPSETVTEQFRLRHGADGWRLVEVDARNLLDDPAVRGVVVNARDLTERENLEQQLQQARKMEAVGRLAGGIAHDFNNLLTGIQGYTQLALETLPEDHPTYGDLHEVDRAAARAAGLTRQLLAFSRRQVMQPRVVELNHAVQHLERMLVRLIGEDIRLVTDLAADAGCAHVDPVQLEQVLLNLAVNARDAMPLGGQLAIRTTRRRLDAAAVAGDSGALTPGDYVELSVSDTGEGMEPDVLERAFEPFFTTKARDKGTGLGLSTVYGIIKQSGGEVRAESSVGDGSTFRILLPRVEGVPEPRDPERRRASGGGGETVLLVEDDGAVRNLAFRVLSRRGYNVLVASNGAEGLRRFEDAVRAAQPIDLLLSDVVMPQLGGRELVELVRESHPALPVILMSGYTDDILVRHGVGTVGADFLEKPFTPAALIDRVRTTLDAAADTGGDPAGPADRG